MCGIAGYYQLQNKKRLDRELIGRMVGIIKHRGPDEFGAYFDSQCVLGQARLSIIDLAGGSQPLSNEDGSIWITYNGEVYNYIELRSELENCGHKFKTKSDTEIIIHAFEQWGTGCLSRFNGQFAFAIYNSNDKSIFLARDRLGIRPVFYTINDGILYFASEIKSIFCEPSIPREFDYSGLGEVFTWWTTAPPKTAFKEINELAPGSFMMIKNDKVTQERYWSMDFPEAFDNTKSINDWSAELHELLVDSVRLRLRADVPVGGYLSGGLDSSATVALIKKFTETKIETFSIAFADKAYDESSYQNQMADFLGTNHHQVSCSYKDIARSFPRVIWHAEKPILRTAPTPLMMLSGLVRQNNFKVVLTGEGADEIFGGYDIFKETLIRKFWAKNPDSEWRPLLLKRLYPTLPISGARAKFYLETFYKSGLSQTDKFYFSHMPRINTTTKIFDFLTEDAREAIDSQSAIAAFGMDLPETFNRRHSLVRAQYLEAKSLLSGYLLSSQGDRVAAANSVETRFPFLDHRVVEFASKIPPKHKIFGLKEKYVLKRAMQKELPPEIVERVKQPYMAPDSNSFFQADSPEFVEEVLSEESLNRAGVFNAAYVQRLKKKCRKLSHAHMSFKDNMSILAVISTQLLAEQYIDRFESKKSISRDEFSIYHDNEIKERKV